MEFRTIGPTYGVREEDDAIRIGYRRPRETGDKIMITANARGIVISCRQVS